MDLTLTLHPSFSPAIALHPPYSLLALSPAIAFHPPHSLLTLAQVGKAFEPGTEVALRAARCRATSVVYPLCTHPLCAPALRPNLATEPPAEGREGRVEADYWPVGWSLLGRQHSVMAAPLRACPALPWR